MTGEIGCERVREGEGKTRTAGRAGFARRESKGKELLACFLPTVVHRVILGPVIDVFRPLLRWSVV